MIRTILGFLAGFIAANVIIILVQMLSGLIYGIPSVNPGDTEAMANHVAGLPTSAFLLIAFGYALGYFVAGFVARKISRSDSLVVPSVIGLLGTIGWTLNIAYIPHPTWMIVLGYLCFIPFALLGHRAASSSRSSATARKA